jgi:hypothetical protein
MGPLHSLLVKMTGHTGNPFTSIILANVSDRVKNLSGNVTKETFLLLIVIGLRFKFGTDKGSGMGSFSPFSILLHMTGATFCSGGRRSVLIMDSCQMIKPA